MAIERKLEPEGADLLRTVVDEVPAMVAYWDKDQLCRLANRAYEKWFGVPPETVVGMTMKELLGPIYPLNLPHIQQALQGQGQEFEREIPDPAGGPSRYSQAHYVPHVVAGEVHGFSVLVVDITRRTRAEQALQAAQRHLEARERLAAMATLAAGIAHEINNPLAAVLGNVELSLDALDGEPLDLGELRSMLQDARDATNRVREIVQSMRVLARGDTVQCEQVNIQDCIEQSLTFAANALRYRTQLTRAIAPDLCVHASAAQLSQVFVNLLVNAGHALPERPPHQNEVRIEARREGDQVVIEVADNGRGIPEELQAHIFEPFFSTKESGEGMGLGLSLCRNMVEGLGGTIGVSSRLGGGTVFRVVLPASPPCSVQVEPLATSRQQSAPVARVRPRVLIVDDEPAVATLLRHVLAAEACEVTAVPSGREALAALEQEAFDLILCDLMMPEMTGEDVYVEATRKQPQLATRFVFLTGGAFTPRGRQFLATIDAPILEKPFHLEELRGLVNQRLRAAQAEARDPLRSEGAPAAESAVFRG